MVPTIQAPKGKAPLPQLSPTMLLMAAADMHAQGQLIAQPDDSAGPPMDIRSGAQIRGTMGSATDWPEGTSPDVRKTFDDRLKSGDITKDQYLKAMRDPRQIEDN